MGMRQHITGACNLKKTLQRVPLWIIGTSHNPRCFSHSLLGCHYRNNKTARVTTDIMVEFLEHFNRKTHRHNAEWLAPLLDNFPVREAAFGTLGGEEGPSNVRITWLPKTTFHYQPNGQDIFQSLKAHTRYRFLSWQIVEYDAHRDRLLQPLDTQAVL